MPEDKPPVRREPDEGPARPGKGASEEERAKNRPKPDDPRKKGDPPSRGSRRK